MKLNAFLCRNNKDKWFWYYIHFSFLIFLIQPTYSFLPYKHVQGMCRVHPVYKVNQNSVSSLVGSISGQDYYEFGVNETWQSGLVWSRLWSKSASQIKTSDTLVVIQTEPTIAWHWFLIHPVLIYIKISLSVSYDFTLWGECQVNYVWGRCCHGAAMQLYKPWDWNTGGLSLMSWMKTVTGK